MSFVVLPICPQSQLGETQTDASAWLNSGIAEGILAGKLLQWMLDSWSVESAYIWDLVAAVNATEPALCPEVPLSVDILTSPGPDQGQTVVTNQPQNVTVCLNPDPEQMKALVATVLGR